MILVIQWLIIFSEVKGMKNGVIIFTGSFGDTNFRYWMLIVNNILSMAYHNIMLFPYAPIFNREILWALS